MTMKNNSNIKEAEAELLAAKIELDKYNNDMLLPDGVKQPLRKIKLEADFKAAQKKLYETYLNQ